LRGAEQDADGDGLANALEWLFGADPAASDASAFLPRIASVTLTADDHPAVEEGKTYLRLSARVRRHHPGATLVPQAAETLETLAAATADSVVPLPSQPDEEGDPDFELRAWFYPTPIEDIPSGRAFLRLKLVLDSN